MLYGEWIVALEAVQGAHTDEGERQWAGDRVTNAKGDRRRGIRGCRLRMNTPIATATPYAESRKL